MNKRNIIIVAIIIAVIAVAIGATLVVLTAYTPYEDTNIKLEVPQGTEFQIMQSNTSLEYISTNPKLHISIVSLDPNDTSVNKTYSQGKSNILKKLKNKKINESENDYNGIIYNTTNKTSNETQYSIVLFNDSTYSTILIESDDLNTVIKAAKSFNLLKPYIIKLPGITEVKGDKKKDSNNTDDLALGFLYGYIYGYYDGYSSSGYDSYDNNDYYYDDSSYYDDYYYDDSYYDDYDYEYYDDYSYDDSFYY